MYFYILSVCGEIYVKKSYLWITFIPFIIDVCIYLAKEQHKRKKEKMN